MRLDRSSQRGSAIVVVLVLTLILLITFVILWFMEKDDREAAQAAATTAQAQQTLASEAAAKFKDLLEEVSRVAGRQTKTLADDLKPELKPFAGGTVISDIKALQGELSPDGTTPEGPGFLNWLKNNTSVEIQATLRSGKNDPVKEAKAEFSWMTPDFRTKLAEVRTLLGNIPPVPSKPVDDDDAVAKAKYGADLEAYEKAFADYKTAADALTALPGYKNWSDIVKLPNAIVDENQVVKLQFYSEPPAPTTSLADLLQQAKVPIVNLKEELKNNKTADVARVAEVTAEKEQLESQLAARGTELTAEQARHTADVANLQKEIETANQKTEENRLAATTAINRAAQLEEEGKRETARLGREITARDERIRQDKAHRDLAVRRDDPDGHVLASNSTMRTASIDLGNADKVFPGLKFAVSRLGRGGLKETVGEVMVLRVNGVHSSQVTILAQSADAPITSGDVVSNPFYSPTESIHVYFAGDLTRYPKSIATERLARMGVVVDAAIGGSTDYVIVPDSMTAPAEKPAEGEGAPAPGKSEFEKLESTARSFGATVITESMLNSFLDY